jgi:hypothetical protein
MKVLVISWLHRGEAVADKEDEGLCTYDPEYGACVLALLSLVFAQISVSAEWDEIWLVTPLLPLCHSTFSHCIPILFPLCHSTFSTLSHYFSRHLSYNLEARGQM